jgi:drug/metabolite transporter (DMT)-like permease
MIVAAFSCLAIEMTAVHAVGARVGTMQIALLRSSGNMALIAAVAATRRVEIRSAAPKAQVARAVLATAGFWASIYAFAHLPLIDATALSYLRGGFMVIFAVLILGEAALWLRWLGVAAGLIGATLILRPAFNDPNIVYLIAVAAPALNAAAVVANECSSGMRTLCQRIVSRAFRGGTAWASRRPCCVCPNEPSTTFWHDGCRSHLKT